jgi:beta-lactamase regulating signal transducer with metallopeptidase domain
MLPAAAVVLVANLALALVGPALARALPPSAATRVLGLGPFVVTAAAGFVISVVCFDFLAQVPAIAAAGRWSAAGLAARDRIPLIIGLGAVVAVPAALWGVSRRALAVCRDLWSAARGCRRLATSTGQLVVIEDARPDAYALPGLVGGRVVVTSAMLAVLDAQERRALLAHEAAHLRHRHHLYLAAGALAAAANPLFRALPRLIQSTVERWADEDAAQATGDRAVTARAVARAALAMHSTDGSLVSRGLAMTGSDASERAMAMLRPAPRRRPGVAAVAGAVVLLAVLGAVEVSQTTERRFEFAHSVYTGR